MSLIDLSEVRQVKSEKKKATIAHVKEALFVYKDTLREAVEMRFEQMQLLAAAMSSKIAPLPGTPNPAQEIGQRIGFLDKTIVRLTDLITASAVVIDYETNPTLLNMFPKILERRQDVIEVIVANRDKTLADTTNEDALLVVGFRDLKRFYETLKLGE